MNRSRAIWIAALALSSLLAACSSEIANDPASVEELSAETASFDLGAGVDQRYLLGIFSSDGGSIVDGTISIDFTHLGAPDTGGPAIRGVEATFVPVAGNEDRKIADSPHLAAPGDGTGAYEADNVRFPQPGDWQATATVKLDGRTVTVDEAFTVLPDQVVPGRGDPAPRTANPTVHDPDVVPTALDSRADQGIVPDPTLHQMAIADAIGTGRPTLVVVSTPTYCVSRFCGPITETVQDLAAEYEARANFVHLEVWSDYEASEVNRAAAEWILPNGPTGDGNEPWVFLIGTDGTIVERWDNVTNGAALGMALDQVV